MQELDGLATAYDVWFWPKFENSPTSATVANAMIGDRELSIKAGMNGHVSKPINTYELFPILAK